MGFALSLCEDPAARVLEPYATVDGLATSPALEGSANPLGQPLATRAFFAAHACHGCLSASACARVEALAEAHVAMHGWRTDRHRAHNTTDFSIHDAPALDALLELAMRAVVLPTLLALYFRGHEPPPTLSISDLFFAKYDTDGGQTSLPDHRDGSLLSFSIAITSPERFEGGGTRFVGKNVVLRPNRPGDLVVHSGKILHGGAPITSGQRSIVVGFVDAEGPNVNIAVLAT